MDSRALVFLLTALGASVVNVHSQSNPFEVTIKIEGGLIQGLKRRAEDNRWYASFRGIPYAKQPLGELRFKELQPVEPWEGKYDAQHEGPICHQTDVLYGRIMKPTGMSECCIHANVHVPWDGLPKNDLSARVGSALGLPILVFIHGGGFAFGSGDADLHGPEYLVSRGVIVITFNYRLNVYGFLSLNSSSVPGNTGLRDMVTLLRWVQRNAEYFGGNPNDVTIMGQSAGAAAAHLLALSKASKGLFKRAILMSGTATSPFFTTSPVFANYISQQLVSILGINATDPEEIHRRLIEMPAEMLNEANSYLLDQIGLTTFFPVVETPFPGVTTILDEDPEVLLAKGRGKDVPLIIGFTDAECETFRRRFEKIDIATRIKANPGLLVPAPLVYSSPPDVIAKIINEIHQRYFKPNVDMDGFVNYCTESYYIYPAMNLAGKRARYGGAPVFLYQFSFKGNYSVFKEVNNLKFDGAGHIEDLTYVFRTDSMLGNHQSFPPYDRDDKMKYWMTSFVTSFMKYNTPVWSNKSDWPPVKPGQRLYQVIDKPNVYNVTEPSCEHPQYLKMIEFFDNIYNWKTSYYSVK